MPLIRSYTNHFWTGRQLRQGRLRVRANNDTRDFRTPDGEPNLGAISIFHRDGDLLAFGWTPWLIPSYLLGLALFGWGSVAFLNVTWGLGDEPPGPWTGWLVAGIGLPLGYWFFLGRAFFRRARYLIVIDRRYGLVHIPRLLRPKRPDAVRFEDASILVTEQGMGTDMQEPHTALHVGQPGWSLWRREYPPLNARRFIFSDRRERSDTEDLVRVIMRFVLSPPGTTAWEAGELSADKIRTGYDGPTTWRRHRWEAAPYYRRLYGMELLTEPNWGYDNRYRWQRQRAGKRERLVLPDGPDDKRIPVDRLGEWQPWWRRLWESFVGELGFVTRAPKRPGERDPDYWWRVRWPVIKTNLFGFALSIFPFAATLGLFFLLLVVMEEPPPEPDPPEREELEFDLPERYQPDSSSHDSHSRARDVV